MFLKIKKKPIFVMMMGLPASGKSTVANKLSVELSATIQSSDNIRIELFGKDYIYNPSDNPQVFGLLNDRIIDELKSGRNVIFDATNIKMKTRMKMLNMLNMLEINCTKVCYYVVKPIDQCLLDNEHRLDGYVMPDDILKMYSQLEIPYYYEGWDNIRVVWAGGFGDNSIRSLFKDPEKGLDNYNVTYDDTGKYYNLGQTLVTAHEICTSMKVPYILANAALFAEIGYPRCEQYEYLKNIDNWNGMSAQDSFFYTCISHNGGGFLRFISDTTKIQKQCLDIAVIIQWMHYKDCCEPLAVKKLERLFDSELKDNIDRLEYIIEQAICENLEEIHK